MYHSGTYANQWMVLDLHTASIADIKTEQNVKDRNSENHLYDGWDGNENELKETLDGMIPISHGVTSNSSRRHTVVERSTNTNQAGIDIHSPIESTEEIENKANSHTNKLYAGFLTVLEEIPGYIHWADQTAHLLSVGYWASYNNPYFPDISVLSGNADLCDIDVVSCYDTDPRAMIFKQKQGKVNSLKDLQYLMGYNNFQIDPLSLNDSCNAIACRQDLEPNRDNVYPFGAIDMKVTSATMLLRAFALEQKQESLKKKGLTLITSEIPGELQNAICHKM